MVVWNRGIGTQQTLLDPRLEKAHQLTLQKLKLLITKASPKADASLDWPRNGALGRVYPRNGNPCDHLLHTCTLLEFLLWNTIPIKFSDIASKKGNKRILKDIHLCVC